MPEMTSILITGARGRIGSALAAYWRDRHRLVLLDRAEGDLTAYDRTWTARFAGVETVIHLAADPSPASGFESAGAGNLTATLNVLRAAHEHGVARLIYASSVWADFGPWQLAERMTWYAASKIAGEALARAWADQYRRPVVCLRFGGFGVDVPADAPVAGMSHLDQAALAFHADAALAWNGPGCVTRYAVGKFGRPDGDGAR